MLTASTRGSTRISIPPVKTVILIAFLLALPLLIETYFVSIAAVVMIWVIAGVGMMVLLGYSGQVSIGHAAFLALGAYAEALLLNAGAPFWLSLPLTVAGSGLLGLVVAYPSLRFAGLYLAMATFAFANIVEAVIGDLDITGGRSGLSVPSAILFGQNVGSGLPFYYLVLFLTLLVYWLAHNLVRSKTGRAWAAIRNSEIAAASMGVSVPRYKASAFAFSTGTAGLAGGLLAHEVGHIAPDFFTLQQSIEILILVVVGGLGTLSGAIYGAIFIVCVPVVISLLKAYVPPAIGQLAGIEAGFFGLVLVFVLLFQPKGIAGGVEQALRLALHPLRREKADES